MSLISRTICHIASYNKRHGLTRGLKLKKCFLFAICFFLSLSSFANDTEIIEQGSSSYYFSATGNSEYLKSFDPLASLSHENVIAGFTRATTKCYFKQIDSKVHCPDYAIGHATMKTGIPRTKICIAAKRAVICPRGCQRKHCTPCVYDSL